MDIEALGVGESADPDHPNAAAVVAAQGFRLLIDCGHSVPPPLWRALPDPDAVDALFVTHTHPDHVFGLVPVLIRWTDDRRARPLDIVAAGDAIADLKRLLAAGGLDPERSLSFPLRWRDVDTVDHLGPFHVRTAPTLHAVPNRALRLEHGGRSFAYSGDGCPTAESAALFRGVDMLFHECFTLAADPTQPFHASFDRLAPLIGGLGVGAARLYHVRRDQRAALAAACGGRIALAVPGESIRLQSAVSVVNHPAAVGDTLLPTGDKAGVHAR